MKYDELVSELLDSVPELNKRFINEMDWTSTSKSLPHIVFGDVLNPFLLEELSNTNNIKLLNRIFIFLETMALSEDKNIRDVLTDTVLERLGDDKEILKKARVLMGNETLKLSHDVEKHLGRE